jgi:hypothetical protein
MGCSGKRCLMLALADAQSIEGTEGIRFWPDAGAGPGRMCQQGCGKAACVRADASAYQ